VKLENLRQLWMKIQKEDMKREISDGNANIFTLSFSNHGEVPCL